jgi:hypothetical protein
MGAGGLKPGERVAPFVCLLLRDSWAGIYQVGVGCCSQAFDGGTRAIVRNTLLCTAVRNLKKSTFHLQRSRKGLVIPLLSEVCILEMLQWVSVLMCRVGQNRIYTPYMTVYLVISLPNIPYIYGSGQPYLCGSSPVLCWLRVVTLRKSRTPFVLFGSRYPTVDTLSSFHCSPQYMSCLN